jgi:cell division protein FtsQ
MFNSHSSISTKGAVRNAPASKPPRNWRLLLDWGKYVGYATLIILLVWGWPSIKATLAEISLGKVEKVTVLGDLTYVPENEVVEVLQPYAEMSVVMLPLSEMQNKLQQISWVDRAVLVRKLPFELIVTIVPQKPIARWRNEGLVNNRGEIFLVDEIAEEFALLPVLSGDHDALQEIMTTYIGINQVLRGHDLDIVSLQRNDRGAWSLQTDDGANVVFGNDGIAEAAKRFVAVHKYLGSEAANKRFDTRHNAGVAVL